MEFKKIVTTLLLSLPNAALATSSYIQKSEQASSSLSVLGGLLVVLSVIFLAAWILGKLSKGAFHVNQSVINTVGAVNVGPKEKVVVLEVAGKWLVVGVGQQGVSSIANLDAPEKSKEDLQTNANIHPELAKFSKNPFVDYMKKALQK